jgi:hypothetical protein
LENVLVLNNSYIPIQIINLKRTLKLLFSGKAEIIDIENGIYNSYNFNSWSEVSLLKKEYWDKNKNYNYFDNGNFIFGIPKVIRLLTYNQIPYKVKLSRRNIFLRDNHTCQYCGKKKGLKQLNIDHVIPKSKDGKNTWENLVCSCYDCNFKKANKTLKEAGMKLLNKPKKPSSMFLFKKYSDIILKDEYNEWKSFFPEDFISDLYMSIELKE